MIFFSVLTFIRGFSMPLWGIILDSLHFKCNEISKIKREMPYNRFREKKLL